MSYETTGTVNTRRLSPTDEQINLDDWSDEELQNIIQENGVLRFADAWELPSTVDHRWYLSEDSDPFIDQVGNADGTNYGTTQVTGDWVEGAARQGNGTDAYIDTTTLGNFGSNRNEFTLSFTIQTTASSGWFGTRASTASNFFFVMLNDDGTLEFFNRDDAGAKLFAATTEAINDGSPHRVTFRYSDAANNEADAHVDGVEATNLTAAENPTSFVDFAYSFILFAINDAGTVANHMDVILDDPMLDPTAWSDAQIQDDYDRQPWV